MAMITEFERKLLEEIGELVIAVDRNTDALDRQRVAMDGWNERFFELRESDSKLQESYRAAAIESLRKFHEDALVKVNQMWDWVQDHGMRPHNE